MDLEALENNLKVDIGTGIGYIDCYNDNTILTSLDFNELSDSSKKYINKLIDERLKFIEKEKKYKVIYGEEI